MATNYKNNIEFWYENLANQSNDFGLIAFNINLQYG